LRLWAGLSVVTAPVASAAAASMTVDISSITVVGTPTATRPLAAFRFTVLDADGLPTALATDETITVSIKSDGLPAATADYTPATTDYTFADTADLIGMGTDTSYGSNASTYGTVKYDGKVSGGANTCDAPDTAQNVGKYCQAVVAVSNKGTDRGTYTITADLTQGSVTLTRLTVKFKSVTSAADSGAVITVASAGTLTSGAGFVNSSTNYMRATLRDANSGYVRTTDTTSASTYAPALSATLENALGTVTQSLTATDTGVSTYDYTTSTGATANDGVYGLIVPVQSL